MKSRIDELARLKGFTMEGLAKASGLSLVTIQKARRDGAGRDRYLSAQESSEDRQHIEFED